MTLHPYHRSGLIVARVCALIALYVVIAAFVVEGGPEGDRALHVRIGTGVVVVASALFWGRMSSGIRLLTVASVLATVTTLLAVGL